MLATQLSWMRTTGTSGPLLGCVITPQISFPQRGRVITPMDYIQDYANTLDECHGMVEWCAVGTTSSRGGVLLRLRTGLLRLRARPALVIQLVGRWPDGPRICLYIPHILYLVTKLFE